jgi:hypothetical protein
LVYAAGILWSKDMEYGLRDVWIKIPMLLFPVFFSFFIINDETVRWVKNGFVLGCLVACLFCLFNALHNVFRTGDLSNMLYTKYSILMFPAYFAMSLNLAILIIMHAIFNNENLRHKGILSIIVLFFAFNIILLSEKMALIAAIITIPAYIIAEVTKRRQLKGMILKIGGFSLLFIVILLFYFKSVNRFSEIPGAIQSFQTENNTPKPDSYYNSSMYRLTLWKYGMDMFKEHWLFGVGTGDIRREEMKRIEADHFHYGMINFETPPGQYIHVAVILGVFGLLFLLASYFLPLYFAFKYKSYLYCGFLLIYIINSTTGTVLSASSVLLYGFFNSFLYVLFEREMKVKLNAEK